MANDTATVQRTASKPDLEKFRLRRFVERLIELGEVEVHDEKVALADLSRIIEASEKAVLFRNAGPEGFELVANVSGSRRRVAAAFATDEAGVVAEFQRRLDQPQPTVEVSSADAPVHQTVVTGEGVDLTRLPFHPQHALDGSVYISSGIDFSVDPETGRTNVGCRRLSLRGRRECGTNVTAPSDLQNIYRGCVARGERLPISFAVGTHPLDFMASGLRIPTQELGLVGTLRGEPAPVVKCVTNDIRVPADAELILEGYLDEEGYVEPEGPFGEYMGLYGPMHLDPIFHVTAITMRRDALHQSILHGSGRIIGRMESAQISAVRAEAQALRLLRSAGIDVAAVRLMTASGEGQNIRIAIRQKVPGQARNAIHLLFGAMTPLKHVFVVDDDIDLWSEDRMEWAMGTRFQADRDTVLVQGLRSMRMDPSLEGRMTGAKAGYDMTRPVGFGRRVTERVAEAPVLEGDARYQSVTQALETGPMFFTQLMQAVGSRDGREVALALAELRGAGRLVRNEDGQYYLGAGRPGRTALDHPPHEEN